MSISAVFGTRVPTTLSPPIGGSSKTFPRTSGAEKTGGSLVIECSSRPNKKATAHHMKTRPRKTQPWDIRRKPTVYAPLPPLPPDWTLVSSGDASGADGGASTTTSSPPPQAPPTS